MSRHLIRQVQPMKSNGQANKTGSNTAWQMQGHSTERIDSVSAAKRI